jgi:hypothetical protein
VFILKKKSNKKVWIIAGAIIAVLAVGAANSDADENETDSPDVSDTKTVNYVLANTEADKESSTITAKAKTIIDETTEAATTEAEATAKYYQEGVYKVGKDLPAGEYLLISYDDQYVGGYMCVSSDSNQNDIIHNELFLTFHYITVENGQYLELTRCGAVSVEEDLITFKSYDDLGPGMYRIGTDIPAGEYKLIADKDAIAAYSCIYDNSTASRKIISNDIINNNAYVTVKQGQYLLLKSCTASLTE